ncbi:MAG: uracil-DNA glycosylase [bacterium]
MASKLSQLQKEIIHCTQCPRLVDWREKVAKEKVRRFESEDYWGKPIPSFGDARARLLLVGLAPAAHGGNRTGRMFTGDRSGDWLFSALYKFGFANQSESINSEDGLALQDCYITAALHCAPPKNKPTGDEKERCFAFLKMEIFLLENVRVIVALGKIAFDTVVKYFKNCSKHEFTKPPAFAHGREMILNEKVVLIASYHPSQQNTFTGRLTRPMFEAIFHRARQLLTEGTG